MKSKAKHVKVVSTFSTCLIYCLFASHIRQYLHAVMFYVVCVCC